MDSYFLSPNPAEGTEIRPEPTPVRAKGDTAVKRWLLTLKLGEPELGERKLRWREKSEASLGGGSTLSR